MAKRLTKQQRQKQAARRRAVRRVVTMLVLAVVAALSVLGWRWRATLPLETVAVEGTRHAAPAEVLRLIGLAADSGVPASDTLLFALDPAILADRAARHPWVAEATVRRGATGTLSVRVTERVPVALALDAAGRPARYYDAHGYAMPLVPTTNETAVRYDLPLLRGRLPESHPTQPVEDAALRGLLAALPTLPPATDALVSEVERRADGTYRLRTPPTGASGALTVTLGTEPDAATFQTLRAFWEQAVLTQPHTVFRSVDLRYDGQIITREADRD
ncbi:MAG: FtsQ-type POTRA domain-containing protein [Bacteroidota bacterium]